MVTINFNYNLKIIALLRAYVLNLTFVACLIVVESNFKTLAMRYCH